MLCPYCHSQNIDNAAKCSNCGQALVRRVGPPPMVNSTGVGTPISTEILEQVSTNPELAQLLENKLKREEEEIKKKAEKKERAKRRRKKFLKGLLITFVSLIVLALATLVVLFSMKYTEGTKLLKQGEYKEAFIVFNEGCISPATAKKRYECAQKALDEGKYGQLMFCLFEDEGCLDNITVTEENKATLYKGVVYRTKHMFDGGWRDSHKIDIMKRVLKHYLGDYKNSKEHLAFFDIIEKVNSESYDNDERLYLIARTLGNVLQNPDATEKEKAVAKELLVCSDLVFMFLSGQENYNDIRDNPSTSVIEGLWASCSWSSTSNDEDMSFHSGAKISASVDIEGSLIGECDYIDFRDGVFYYCYNSADDVKGFKLEIINYSEIKIYNYATGETTSFERGNPIGLYVSEDGKNGFVYY